jgi:hypothetical protein
VPAVVLIEWWRAGFSRRHSELIAPMNIEPTTLRIAKAAGEALTSNTSGSVVGAVRALAFPADQLTRPERRRAGTPRHHGRFRLIDARHARSFAVGKRADKTGGLHGAGLDGGFAGWRLSS